MDSLHCNDDDVDDDGASRALTPFFFLSFFLPSGIQIVSKKNIHSTTRYLNKSIFFFLLIKLNYIKRKLNYIFREKKKKIKNLCLCKVQSNGVNSRVAFNKYLIDEFLFEIIVKKKNHKDRNTVFR